MVKMGVFVVKISWLVDHFGHDHGRNFDHLKMVI